MSYIHRLAFARVRGLGCPAGPLRAFRVPHSGHGKKAMYSRSLVATRGRISPAKLRVDRTSLINVAKDLLLSVLYLNSADEEYTKTVVNPGVTSVVIRLE